jgi:hypothetical protein
MVLLALTKPFFGFMLISEGQSMSQYINDPREINNELDFLTCLPPEMERRARQEHAEKRAHLQELLRKEAEQKEAAPTPEPSIPA